MIYRPPVHPVLSIAASATPSPASQAAIFCSDRQNAGKCFTTTVCWPGSAPGSRTATQMIFLCTSMPATRGWTISIPHLPAVPDTWIRARRPRSPQQDQDPVIRARSSNPGYPPGRLQRQSLIQARSAKEQRRQRAAQPQVSFIRGRHVSDIKSLIRASATQCWVAAVVTLDERSSVALGCAAPRRLRASEHQLIAARSGIQIIQFGTPLRIA